MRLFDEEFFKAIDKILDSCDDKDRLWKGILDDGIELINTYCEFTNSKAPGDTKDLSTAMANTYIGIFLLKRGLSIDSEELTKIVTYYLGGDMNTVYEDSEKGGILIFGLEFHKRVNEFIKLKVDRADNDLTMFVWKNLREFVIALDRFLRTDGAALDELTENIAAMHITLAIMLWGLQINDLDANIFRALGCEREEK